MWPMAVWQVLRAQSTHSCWPLEVTPKINIVIQIPNDEIEKHQMFGWPVKLSYIWQDSISMHWECSPSALSSIHLCARWMYLLYILYTHCLMWSTTFACLLICYCTAPALTRLHRKDRVQNGACLKARTFVQECIRGFYVTVPYLKLSTELLISLWKYRKPDYLICQQLNCDKLLW